MDDVHDNDQQVEPPFDHNHLGNDTDKYAQIPLPSKHAISSDDMSYYQRSILAILNAIMDVYGNILDENETLLVDMLRKELDGDAQRLFFRLYLRKGGWIRERQLEYRDIVEIGTALARLDSLGLLERTFHLIYGPHSS